MGFGANNIFTALYRALNYRAPSLTLASAAPVGGPFISNSAANVAIINLTGASANHFNVVFIARDANGNIETDPVFVEVSGATGTISMAPATGGGTITSKITTALGQRVAVTPNATTGLVSLDVTCGTAEQKNVTITQRYVAGTGQITVI